MQRVQTGHDHSEPTCLIYVPHGQISVPAETYQRLDEWGRWARPRLRIDPHGHCASAEGRYQPESDIDTGIDAMPISLPVDLHSVLAVERVVCTKLPCVSRELMRRHFVLHNPPRQTARALGIHTHRYGDELRRSILMVRNCLTYFC